MLKYFKYPITIFFSLTLILVFTAFGCKEQEDDQEDNNNSEQTINSAEQVTYNETATTEVVNNDGNDIKEEAVNNDNDENSSVENNQVATQESSNNSEEEMLLEKSEKLAEIFGTYTNKDKESFKNLKDLKQYTTATLNSWIDRKSQEKIDSNAPFYGVTTSALSSVYLEKSNTKAKIIVTVKKEEITSKSNTPAIVYKVILMNFEKVNEDWKLSSIYWQD